MTFFFILIAIVFVLSFFSKLFSSNNANNNQSRCEYCHLQKKIQNHIIEYSKKKYNGAIYCSDCLHRALINEVKNKNNLIIQPLPIPNRPLPSSKATEYINVPEFEEKEIGELSDDILKLKLNTIVQLTYCDAKNQQSVRKVTIKSLYQLFDGKDYFLDAFCHEKKAQRTFKLSRIVSLVDIETGEIFPNPVKYFMEKLNNSPSGEVTQCFQKLEDEILVMTFVARADGYLRIKERNIIASYIEKRHGSQLDKSILDNEIRLTYCDNKEFNKSLNNLSKNIGLDKKAFAEIIHNIVNTEKTIHPLEKALLFSIDNELKIIN